MPQGGKVHIVKEVICPKKGGGTRTLNNQFLSLSISVPEGWGIGVQTRTGIVSALPVGKVTGTARIQAEVQGGRHDGLKASSSVEVVPSGS